MAHWGSMHKALGLIPSTEKKKSKQHLKCFESTVKMSGPTEYKSHFSENIFYIVNSMECL